MSNSMQYGLWELAVLSLLRERAMHPYEILRTLRERHKDDVLVLKRGSLYHAIRRLEAGGLIEALEISREGRRPERTTYRLTPPATAALMQWLRGLLDEPQNERAVFVGALNFIFHLPPKEAEQSLQRRAEALERQIGEFDQTLALVQPRIGRIHTIETEFTRAMRAAELGWIRSLITDLQSGRFHWETEAILESVRASAYRPSGGAGARKTARAEKRARKR
jgi:DNA-binding PadR family transcriptional regulator